MSKKFFNVTVLSFVIIVVAIIASIVIYFKFGKSITPYLSTPVTQMQKIEKPYEIAWQGDKNDKSGRTVLAKGQRADGLLPDKFYWSWEHNKELNLIGYTQGVGVFYRWENIIGTKDRYLILKNPDSKKKDTEQIAIRAILERKKGSSFVPTRLSVEDLNYGFYTKSVAFPVPIDYFINLSQQDIDTLIKPGDVITVNPVFLDIETAKKQKALNQKDENGYFIAQTVLIRRFGGKEAILSELTK